MHASVIVIYAGGGLKWAIRNPNSGICRDEHYRWCNVIIKSVQQD